MKILMLGWELPPHNSGGLGVACYHLCKALAKRKVDIDFILPYTADHKIDFMRIDAAHPQDVQAVTCMARPLSTKKLWSESLKRKNSM
jgi:glycogen synthase